MSLAILILSVLLLGSVTVAVYFFRKRGVVAESRVVSEPAAESGITLRSEWEAERQTLVSEKTKFEEKNRKLWQMSETVHKERKVIEEQNELLLVEKEKLASEKRKLDERVKKLWQTSTAIHKEKERINELKLEIERKHQEILDSVNYAQRIQRALLANSKLLKAHLPEHFVLFLPKDIVSGDFYWASRLSNGEFSVVTADSTGHGVPGAIMSILNISCLNEAVNVKDLAHPNEILNYTRRRIMEHMANDGSEEGGKDGMDAVICNFDFVRMTLRLAAANNPVWMIRNGEFLEFRPDKMPVGKGMGEQKPFTLQEAALEKGDLVIMLTDGFADQFGGAKGRKFMYKPLKELILSVSDLPCSEICDRLNTALDRWKGTTDQVDDVCLIGVRI